MKIQGEQIFGIPTENFAVGATTSGYTLAYSADGETFTNWKEATPAGENLVVAGSTKGLSYKLVGNTGTAYIQY